ncbi:MAG: hypothetical protein N3B12_02400 [Armatimonadetes bacterium]|nr:hypothetical protein [Armatimonadota bacterium]
MKCNDFALASTSWQSPQVFLMLKLVICEGFNAAPEAERIVTFSPAVAANGWSTTTTSVK